VCHLLSRVDLYEGGERVYQITPRLRIVDLTRSKQCGVPETAFELPKGKKSNIEQVVPLDLIYLRLYPEKDLGTVFG